MHATTQLRERKPRGTWPAALEKDLASATVGLVALSALQDADPGQKRRTYGAHFKAALRSLCTDQALELVGTAAADAGISARRYQKPAPLEEEALSRPPSSERR